MLGTFICVAFESNVNSRRWMPTTSSAYLFCPVMTDLHSQFSNARKQLGKEARLEENMSSFEIYSTALLAICFDKLNA